MSTRNSKSGNATSPSSTTSDNAFVFATIEYELDTSAADAWRVLGNWKGDWMKRKSSSEEIEKMSRASSPGCGRQGCKCAGGNPIIQTDPKVTPQVKVKGDETSRKVITHIPGKKPTFVKEDLISIDNMRFIMEYSIDTDDAEDIASITEINAFAASTQIGRNDGQYLSFVPPAATFILPDGSATAPIPIKANQQIDVEAEAAVAKLPIQHGQFPFTGHVATFKVVPVSFCTCKLVWEMGAQSKKANATAEDKKELWHLLRHQMLYWIPILNASVDMHKDSGELQRRAFNPEKKVTESSFAKTLAEDWIALIKNVKEAGYLHAGKLENLVNTVVPVAVEGMSELLKEMEIEAIAEATQQKMQKKNPCMKNRRTFNPVHWLAAYMMKKNPKYVVQRQQVMKDYSQASSTLGK